MSSERTRKEPQQLYKAAVEAYENRDFATSLQLVERGLQTAPYAGELWELKGLLHRARNEWALSVQAFEEASTLVPLTDCSRISLGFAYLRDKQEDAARAVFELLAEKPDLPDELALQVAAGLDELEEPVEAMDICRKVLDREPDYAQAYYDMGYYAARCGYPVSRTEALARKAIALEPNNVQYRVGLTGLLIKQSRRDEALKLLDALSDDQLLTIGCRCCLERIAALFESMGEYRKNILCRERLLELELAGGTSDCE